MSMAESRSRPARNGPLRRSASITPPRRRGVHLRRSATTRVAPHRRWRRCAAPPRHLRLAGAFASRFGHAVAPTAGGLVRRALLETRSVPRLGPARRHRPWPDGKKVKRGESSLPTLLRKRLLLQWRRRELRAKATDRTQLAQDRTLYTQSQRQRPKQQNCRRNCRRPQGSSSRTGRAALFCVRQLERGLAGACSAAAQHASLASIMRERSCAVPGVNEPEEGSLRVRSSAAPAHGAKCTCLATPECRPLHAPGSRRPASHGKKA